MVAGGLGASRHRPRDEPEFGLCPAGDEAGDDIGKAALGDDRVGIGEDSTACVQGGLRREVALGGVVLGHGRGSFWGLVAGDINCVAGFKILIMLYIVIFVKLALWVWRDFFGMVLMREITHPKWQSQARPNISLQLKSRGKVQTL